MRRHHPLFSRLLPLLLSGLLSSAMAQEIPTNPADIQNVWGSVLYCQNIYSEPGVSGRVYPGDLQDCEKADALLRWSVSQQYGPGDKETLERFANKKAGVIRYNTRDVQQAVGASHRFYS
jgi:hypothetical protein